MFGGIFSHVLDIFSEGFERGGFPPLGERGQKGSSHGGRKLGVKGEFAKSFWPTKIWGGCRTSGGFARGKKGEKGKGGPPKINGGERILLGVITERGFWNRPPVKPA